RDVAVFARASPPAFEVPHAPRCAWPRAPTPGRTGPTTTPRRADRPGVAPARAYRAPLAAAVAPARRRRPPATLSPLWPPAARLRAGPRAAATTPHLGGTLHPRGLGRAAPPAPALHPHPAAPPPPRRLATRAPGPAAGGRPGTCAAAPPALATGCQRAGALAQRRGGLLATGRRRVHGGVLADA